MLDVRKISLTLELRESGIFDSKVLSAIEKTPREIFIPENFRNQAYENIGLTSTQKIATLFDGMARHSPEGVWFKQRAEKVGFKQAVAERDSGDFIPGSKN